MAPAALGGPLSELLPALRDLLGRVRQVPGKGLVITDGGVEHWVEEGAKAVSLLRETLYARYFCRQTTPAYASRYAARASGEPSFVGALVEATARSTYLEPGWQVAKADSRWAFVSNGRVSLFLDDRRQLEPPSARVGSTVQVRLPCARENLAPGFFYLLGRAGPIDAAKGHLRAYLNLSAEAAPEWVRALCTRPGLAPLRFEAKLVNDPALFGRADAAVLYLAPESAAAMLAWLGPWCRASAGRVRADDTPLFTRAVAPGLAIAEVAAAGVSPAEGFGQRRCRLAAEELVAAIGAGELSAEAWARRISERFSQEGLGSVDGPRSRRVVARG